MALFGQGSSEQISEDGNKVISPANFVLRRLSLQRENLGGQEIGTKGLDIKNLAGEIVINESIYKNAINVDIRILDNIKLLSTLRLNGTEKIKLDIARDADTNVETFRLDLVVADLDLYTEVDPSTQSYVLKCVPEYSLINQSKTISDRFTDIAEAIRAICTGDLKIPKLMLDRPLRKKEKKPDSLNAVLNRNRAQNDPFNLNLTPEEINEDKLPTQPAKGIYPSMKPLSAINWLVRNISNNSTPYYFYQTSNGVVKLRSYQQMIQDEHIHIPYTNNSNISYFDKNSVLKNSADDLFEVERFSILKINQPANLATIANMAAGAYASKKHTIDIYKKSYKNDDDFEYSGMQTLNEQKPFPDQVKFGGSKLTENFSGKNYYINLNSGAFDSNDDNYHAIVNDTIQKKEAYHNILNSQQQEIIINGDFLLNSGSTINLELIQNKSEEKMFEDDEIDVPDKMLSGKYLVTSLEHRFQNQSYTTRLRCKRDSYNLDVNEPEAFLKDPSFFDTETTETK